MSALLRPGDLVILLASRWHHWRSDLFSRILPVLCQWVIEQLSDCWIKMKIIKQTKMDALCILYRVNFCIIGKRIHANVCYQMISYSNKNKKHLRPELPLHKLALSHYYRSSNLCQSEHHSTSSDSTSSVTIFVTKLSCCKDSISNWINNM